MATPQRAELDCPLCGSEFWAPTMGSSYYISGADSDLREVGSIEEVRRFSISSCQVCRYSDYSWDFTAPTELESQTRNKLEEMLGVDSARPGPALNRTIGDFERLHLAAQCFRARGLDSSALAELALLAYYVARDLGRQDIEPSLRDEAAMLFAETLEEEELPSPLRLRYSYLAGELNRRSGQRADAEKFFDQAIAASEADEDEDETGAAWDIARMARRKRTAVQHHDAGAAELLELTRAGDEDQAAEARRMLACRRDSASVEATRTSWEEAAAHDRTEMLRELVIDPSSTLFDLFTEALESPAPEDIRLAARALGALGEERGAAPLIKALERGVLSTEGALVEALRRVNAPDTLEKVANILEEWEQRDRAAQEDSWYFASDTTPLKNLLYVSGHPKGLELLIRDMRELSENDLWDKVPSGGPVSAALTLNTKVALALRGLLSDENPAARRWATYCLAETGEQDAKEDIAPLVTDADTVLRLQAASALARLGDASHEAVVLEELKKLDEGDLPFALHFLLEFKSAEVKAFLFELLEGGQTTPGEVLPLLGRQEPDDQIASVLTTRLLDTNDDTRAGAVTGLAFQGSDGAGERLRLLYDQEFSDEVLRRIILGLGRLAKSGVNREETVTFLRERLNRANPRLRYSVALTLLQLGDPTGIDIVRDRAALFDESADRYDLVAPALKALAAYQAEKA